MTVAPATGGGSAPSASSGIEIVSPRSTPAADNGLRAGGPDNSTRLPPTEKPQAAPDTVNDIAPGQAPPAQAAPASGKKAGKPQFDKNDESSSKHKKKKGLKKVNPF